MLVCIAAENGQVSPHFGHCPEFALYEIEGKRIGEVKTIPNPGHSPGTLPPYLKQLGVNHVISGGMGQRAVSHFRSFGIEVTVGVQGELDQIISRFVSGELEGSENICDHT